MAFKPYCQECVTWHTEKEGHIMSEPLDQLIASFEAGDIGSVEFAELALELGIDFTVLDEVLARVLEDD